MKKKEEKMKKRRKNEEKTKKNVRTAYISVARHHPSSIIQHRDERDSSTARKREKTGLRTFLVENDPKAAIAIQYSGVIRVVKLGHRRELGADSMEFQHIN